MPCVHGLFYTTDARIRDTVYATQSQRNRLTDVLVALYPVSVETYAAAVAQLATLSKQCRSSSSSSSTSSTKSSDSKTASSSIGVATVSEIADHCNRLLSSMRSTGQQHAMPQQMYCDAIEIMAKVSKNCSDAPTSST
jgi:hypothetical protein